jgi:hypothetical protein
MIWFMAKIGGLAPVGDKPAYRGIAGWRHPGNAPSLEPNVPWTMGLVAFRFASRKVPVGLLDSVP